ncbi:hypothetical protein MJO10_33445, partial [Salmonella enterica subsp. enterica serovar Anatum]|nr:hypothetical protein [Salmonella enterica subsp. enterica serovar Anatum]
MKKSGRLRCRKYEEDNYRYATPQSIFNNAAQVWNHTFYWNCLAPNAGGEPTGRLAEAIAASFGSFA